MKRDTWNGHRVIMHLDMDAFFAAIEQAIHPALKGKAVIVGGMSESRGVVSTCSYEARNYGVHSAMPMKQAFKLCPDAVYIDSPGDKYAYVSLEILNILHSYSPAVEQVSIDEAFADLTGIHERYGGLEPVARSIKKEIYDNFGLTASIGIAPNRFVAKMASSSLKPDGLVIVPPDKVKQFLWVRPVDHLWGVGPKSKVALNKVGITTIGDLAKTPITKLKAMFGVMGEALQRMANGDGGDEVRLSHEESDTKSMGHEHTFARDTNDADMVLGLLLYLSDRVSRRLRLHGYVGRSVTLKIRKSDFQLVTRATTLSIYIDTEREIYKAAKELLIQNRFLAQPLRLIGVNVSHLKKSGNELSSELDIGYDPLSRCRTIDKVLDQLRDRHGEEAIFFAGSQMF
jgi:nucleotidyltransferase/DNA polymerase involved in DNA repair